MARAPVRRRAVALGNFDGVHLGHRQVVEAVVEEARRREATPAVLVLDPHPRTVLHPEAPQRLMTDLPERGALLVEAGAEELLVLPFGPEAALMAPAEFARTVRRGSLGAVAAVVGENYRFGHEARGTVADLGRLGEELSFATRVVPPFEKDGGIVSATRIRALLAKGDVEEAAGLLARPYALSGTVQEGARRGREIGFPTLNLSLDPRRVWPAFGVYAVRATVGGLGTFGGVANFGGRPTFDQAVLLEAHLFGFAEEAYGVAAKVSFIRYLRPQRPFPSVAELRRQIADDARSAREVLEASPA